MESRCITRFVRITPRKMRLVAQLVRGKNVNDAINVLKFTPRAGSLPTLKAIQSAVANLVNSDRGQSVNPDELFVKTVLVDEGPRMKRFMPRAQGRATPILKRMSHLTVLIATPPAPVEAVAEKVEETPAPVETKPAKAAKPVAKPATKAKPAATAKAKKPAAKSPSKPKTSKK